MPVDKSLKKVLVIGSGPIVIGQAAEFDYSGSQALESLREEGIEVSLINSNPATIMTDQEMCERVYMEPLTKEFLLKVIYQERPDGILPTLGGQTALNLAMEIAREGVFEKTGTKLLGTNPDTIHKAEDREAFRSLMKELGEPISESQIISSWGEAEGFVEKIGLPLIIRPAYTLGGTGGGIASTMEELKTVVASGLAASPINQVLIEKSIAGYKEIEYEVIRDAKDNCIVICNMENFDPVGIHTGDSIVVAPSQTLSDKEYQLLRDASLRIVRALKIEGGCNVQLALDPDSFQYYVIEVNPRVSRSSALASKATGYPIAKIAAKIALGLSLDEIKNPITKVTSACFEPSLDYIVTKIPRWPFDKFTSANRRLGTQMKATGEVMAIGRNFEESLHKAIRSLELGPDGFDLRFEELGDNQLKEKIQGQDDERIFALGEAFRRGITTKELHQLTKIDYWFLDKISFMIAQENKLSEKFDINELQISKKMGFTDRQIANATGKTTKEIRDLRIEHGITPTYKMVDTCAGEFQAETPYFYSTYGEECEVEKSGKDTIVILGSGPIRIGQGVEFDYATVHAVKAVREMGLEAVVVNSNPETVSTDFNVSDRLYFDPLNLEDVLNIVEKENAKGVIVQFGGQTAINLAQGLHDHGVKILGTSLENIDRAENREKFEKLLRKLNIAQPLGHTVFTVEEAISKTEELGFPVMVRPSYVLGGRAMEIVEDQEQLKSYLQTAVKINPEHPVLIDRYIIGKEVEIDAISDGETVFVPGIMEHIERAGVHSGDSMAVYPPQNIDTDIQKKLVEIAVSLARGLEVKGLLNIQFVVKKSEVFVIEVNPRSSRTVPFLSKVTHVPMAQIATRAILGESIVDQGYFNGLWPEADFVSVKAPVFSFAKLVGVETALGPEMKSTGESIGRDTVYEKALYKALLSAGAKIPSSGNLLVTIADKHKEEASSIVEKFIQVGFRARATAGTAKFLREKGLDVEEINRIEQPAPNLLTEIKAGSIDIILNTLSKGKGVASDGFLMRRSAVENNVLCLTSLDTADAMANMLRLIGFTSLPMPTKHPEAP